MITITDAFDGGNIEHVGTAGSVVDLRIKPDNASDFFQWFNFRVLGGKGKALTLRILNAGEASYVKGWEDYGVCISHDRQSWDRYPTRYKDGVLTIEHMPVSDAVQVAYFAPYSMERHHDLIAHAVTAQGYDYRSLGQTLMGQSMDCLSMGDGPLSAWVIARQHPGETMAEWWMEGFLEALSEDTDIALEARKLMRFQVVPNMNPDGSRLGNLRTNFAGANLNREWNVATAERSPEVLCVRDAMAEDEQAFCLDVHGDEALPYNFIAGAEGIPGYSNDQAAQLDTFLNAYTAAAPEFQTKYGYGITPAGTANLSMCTNYCAHAFGGLAMTLEMPFKDDANHPDVLQGWSPARCRKLGRNGLTAMVVWARSRD